MASSIPLHCNICPKHPKFSDLSHLLTHVASKGHLSHYFKAQVRSASEPSVRKELEIYDKWYDRHRISKLMCQRMITKDNKLVKTERRRHIKPDSIKQEAIKQEAKFPKVASVNGQKRAETKVKREIVIDPQLASVPASSTEQRDDGDDLEFQGQITRPGVPFMSSRVADEKPKDEQNRLQARASIGSLPYPFLKSNDEGGDSKPVIVDEKESIYPDPSTVQPHGFDVLAIVELGSTGSSLTSVPSDTPEIEDLQSVAECSKLKGTIWPGMDLFDSASALAKRRRNQKKDGSMLAQMKWTSATVRPKEVIYTLDGNIHKTQPITGQVESSPFKQPTPKPKRVRAKPKRPALGPVTSNTTGTQKPRPNGGPPRRRGRPRNIQPPNTPTRPPTARKKAVQKRRPAPPNDDEVEWQIATGEEVTGQRKKMKVHQDAIAIDSTIENSLSEELPAFDSNDVYTYFEETSSYTPSPLPLSHGLPYLNSGFTSHSPYLNHAAFGSQALDHGAPNPLHPANKENIKPMLNPLGRIDDSAANVLVQGRRNAHQYFDVAHSQSTHFFNTYPSNMPFGSYYPGGFPTGSYMPQMQYQSAAQYPYAPTMPTANPLRPTYTALQPPVFPMQPTPPPQKRPQVSRHLRTSSPRGTIVVDTTLQSNPRIGTSGKDPKLMTKPGGPGSEDGDSGDDTIDEDILADESGDDEIHASHQRLNWYAWSNKWQKIQMLMAF